MPEPSSPTDNSANAIKTIGRLFSGKLGACFLTALVAFFLATFGLTVFLLVSRIFHIPTTIPTPALPPISKPKAIEKFASAEDFKFYLKETEEGGDIGGLGMVGFRPLQRGLIDFGVEPMITLETAPGAEKKAVPERVSETTVQVAGIDEPDIVKTDGREIYFSPSFPSIRPPMILPALPERSTPQVERIPPAPRAQTKVIKAFPPADLDLEVRIERTGELLLADGVLIIFSGDTIYGYDISDPTKPERKWDIELESKNRIVGARLYKDKIYLVTQTQIDTYNPCPIRPLSVNGDPLSIKCIEIYHPVANVPVDVTYTAMIIDPSDGEVKDRVSFVGSSGTSIVYMSENAIYATYSYFESLLDFFYGFFKSETSDLVPSSIIFKVEKLRGYDISDTSKMMELETILKQWQSSLDDDERLRVENELSNRMENYYKKNRRELEKTGIVKIGLDKFKVQTTGHVPGRPLNQFSLDEYKGNLRVATTVGDGMLGRGESANDVYVLDQNLKIVGSVKDMGLTERIYSVRFIEDKGYVVTFRQIDPFYVLDLSNPEKPELKGELKIPGYSSYLHPITKDKILGIGKEGSKVKISLFDVSDPEDPAEADKYLMEESWSDILNTHHAFLLDAKRRIFFLPGSRGGYVFSYRGDRLNLEKAVSNIHARRAIYINNYLYIIGDDKLVILNETDWTQVNQLEF